MMKERKKNPGADQGDTAALDTSAACLPHETKDINRYLTWNSASDDVQIAVRKFGKFSLNEHSLGAMIKVASDFTLVRHEGYCVSEGQLSAIVL